MLCDHLEGWNREGGREGDARGKTYVNICICITDSLFYKAETNTPLLSNYTPIKILKKKDILVAKGTYFYLKITFSWRSNAPKEDYPTTFIIKSFKGKHFFF